MRVTFLVGADASYGAGLAARHEPLAINSSANFNGPVGLSGGDLASAPVSLLGPTSRKDSISSGQIGQMVDRLNDAGRHFVQFELAYREESRCAELLLFAYACGSSRFWEDADGDLGRNRPRS